MTERRKNLFYLDELSDYKVTSEDPDVRGWDVKDKDNRVIGKVEDLLVNKDREQVVYLDVEVDESIIEANHDPYSRSARDGVHEFINKDGEEHLIIPVGLVQVDDDRKFVYTDRIDYQTFAETKRFEKGSAVERDYEVIVLDSYDRFGNPDQNQRDRQWDDRPIDSSYTNRDTDRGDFETRPDDLSRRASRDFENRPEGSLDRDSREFDSRPDDSNRRDTRDLNRDRERDVSFEGDTDRFRSETSYRSEGSRDRYPDDDTFYDRREFDRKNWRRRR